MNMDYYHELYDQATDFGVEVEAHRTLVVSRLLRRTELMWSDTETGPGVFETALAYTDSGRMADNAVLFKFVAKSVGMKHGITPSFMAKPYSDVGPPTSA